MTQTGSFTLVVSLFQPATWMWQTSWRVVPNAAVSIDGIAARGARVYKSADEHELLIYPADMREFFHYLVDLKGKQVGATWFSDWWALTWYFATPVQNPPLRDWAPNETDDSTEPDLKVKGHELQFYTYKGLLVKVDY